MNGQQVWFGQDPNTQLITVYFELPVQRLDLTVEQAEAVIAKLQQQIVLLQAGQN